ncbi:MAG: circularly permuted type 2 ATP-grasp protein [Pseudomonadota bacterium]
MPTQIKSGFALSSLDYTALDHRDELLDENGQLRPHWKTFYEDPQGLNPALTSSRQKRLDRALLENALTYADTDRAYSTSARPLTVDAVPLILPEKDWKTLRDGARQRARLLNMVLADLYGPQNLLKSGLLPAPLALANPDFLRPLHGVTPYGGTYLHAFAMDVARGADGNWWVLRDHSQATAASGFALENRILMGQLYPEMTRALGVRRLAGYFQDFQQHIASLSGNEEPRILCYTNGPTDPRYLAQAYLARYLGYTMSEGSDLTMRNGKVYFKTLDGLKKVDVLLRQVHAMQCDPLELDAASQAGVPGLVTAIRNNAIAVANALGSGVVETNALAGFMPKLSEHLLGEDLKLPNLATWWCGQADAADYVHEHFDDLSIGPAFDGDRVAHKAILESPQAERRELLAHYGQRIIGQERMALPTTPVQSGNTLVPAPYVLRLFVAAGEEDFTVLPGGLVLTSAAGRAASTEDFSPTTMKDCWTIAPGLDQTVSLLPREDGAVKIRRTGKDLASRAADNLFWLGRYTERTEMTGRLMRTVIAALTQDGQIAADPAALAAAALPIMTRAGLMPNKKGKKAAAFPDRLRHILGDKTISYSLPNCVSGVLGTAGRVRDRLSPSTFITLQRLQDQSDRLEPLFNNNIDLMSALPPLDDMMILLTSFAGQAQENMTRNSGWAFLDMGRRLERGLHMVETIAQLLVTTGKVRDGRLVLLLDLADSFMTYRARYMTNPMVAPVLDLLLQDETNPRSVAFQIAQIDRHLEGLTGGSTPVMPPERRLIYDLLSRLRLAHVAELSETNEKGVRTQLAALLKSFEAELFEFSPTIARSYFSHAEMVSDMHALTDKTDLQ